MPTMKRKSDIGLAGSKSASPKVSSVATPVVPLTVLAGIKRWKAILKSGQNPPPNKRKSSGFTLPQRISMLERSRWNRKTRESLERSSNLWRQLMMSLRGGVGFTKNVEDAEDDVDYDGAGERTKSQFTRNAQKGLAGAEGSRKPMYPTGSGYVNVPEYALNLVADPYEIRSMIQHVTKKLYCFWAFLIVAASFLNAVTVFVVRYLGNIFSKDTLHTILFDGDYNAFGIIGVILSLIILAVWGCLMLTHPEVKSALLQIARWCFPIIVLLYMLYCVGTQIYELNGIKSKLATAMHDDLRNAMLTNDTHETLSSIPLYINKLQNNTQEYLQCCGVVDSKDWASTAHRKIPSSCCDEAKYRGCYTLDLDLPKNSHTLFKSGCLNKEYFFTGIVMMVVLSVEIFCIVATVGVLAVVHSVLKDTNEFAVAHVHPFV